MAYKETFIPSPTAPPDRPEPSALHRLRLPTSPSATGFLTLACTYLLAFELLQQLPATTHAPTPLPYLFLAAIDGFIAFALFSAVRLESDESDAGVYAWAMAFLAIPVRGVTVLTLGHLGTRRSQGRLWQLDDVAVTWMSALAPFILFFAVVLYVLVAGYGADLYRERPQDGDAR
ncbi:hypothetical protein OG824_27185 [Streptomyces prunicolor]|uniref:hypothetical protein n=1 Tax=Streptomyces prunicolor TaxID=67348 RepID=UPI00224DA59A|nr:hypothetical protein [Streptomyces prunicolor]MCX5238892.1 hypothetical protein [Streptomyces prunicolor]